RVSQPPRTEDWALVSRDSRGLLLVPETQIKLFYDSRVGGPAATPDRAYCGGFYSTVQSSPHAIFRVKGSMDDVSPSLNGVSVSNLFRLGYLLNETSYIDLAKETIVAFEVEIPVHPGLFMSLLINLVAVKAGGTKLLIFGEGDGTTE